MTPEYLLNKIIKKNLVIYDNDLKSGFLPEEAVQRT